MCSCNPSSIVQEGVAPSRRVCHKAPQRSQAPLCVDDVVKLLVDGDVESMDDLLIVRRLDSMREMGIHAPCRHP